VDLPLRVRQLDEGPPSEPAQRRHVLLRLQDRRAQALRDLWPMADGRGGCTSRGSIGESHEGPAPSDVAGRCPPSHRRPSSWPAEGIRAPSIPVAGRSARAHRGHLPQERLVVVHRHRQAAHHDARGGRGGGSVLTWARARSSVAFSTPLSNPSHLTRARGCGPRAIGPLGTAAGSNPIPSCPAPPSPPLP
jgi:hypothetical protein